MLEDEPEDGVVTVVIPFDGSEQSRVALHRADELKQSSEEVIAVSVIPDDNAKYARERGWLTDTVDFDLETIVSHLRNTVGDISSETSFEYIVTSRYANAGKIAKEIRKFARGCDTRVVVIGSESAGRIIATVGSIGRTVVTDQAYDVYISRTSNNA